MIFRSLELSGRSGRGGDTVRKREFCSNFLLHYLGIVLSTLEEHETMGPAQWPCGGDGVEHGVYTRGLGKASSPAK